MKNQTGFTLVELVIVVLILGIIAAIAAPRVLGTSEDARQAAFARELQVFVEAAYTFKAMTGEYPMDSGSGSLGGDGFSDYVHGREWGAGTPIGGVWDAELNSFGVTSAIGVHFWKDSPKSTEYMTEIDTMIDDGDINSGSFRKLANDRFYFVVEE